MNFGHAPNLPAWQSKRFGPLSISRRYHHQVRLQGCMNEWTFKLKVAHMVLFFSARSGSTNPMAVARAPVRSPRCSV